MGSIARMRPRTQQKKKTSDRDEDDDSHSSLGSIDDEDAKIQTKLAGRPHMIATTPLLRSISMEIGDSAAKRNGTNDSDDHGTWDSCVNYDKKAMHCTPFRIESRERDRSTCATTAIGDSDFDLFDDLDEIKLCNCNGAGSCFIQNLKL